MQQEIALGSKYSITIGSTSENKIEQRTPFEEEVFYFVDDKNTEQKLSGTVVFSTPDLLVVSVDKVSYALIPFTLFFHEVLNRIPEFEDEGHDVFQRYYCVDRKTNTSLYCLDVNMMKIVDAIYDENGDFDCYDFEEDNPDEGYKTEIGCYMPNKHIETIDIQLPAEELELYDQQEVLANPDEVINLDENGNILSLNAHCNWQRSYHWINNCDCGIITAWRSTKVRKENDANNKKLQRTLRKLGYGVSKVRGFYKEIGQEPNTENSFLVFDLKNNSKEFRDNLYHLSEKYEQDSFLYNQVGYNMPAIEIGTNDNFGKGKIKIAGRLRFGNMSAEAYSEIGSGRISFEKDY